jgi:hypothetical protein
MADGRWQMADGKPAFTDSLIRHSLIRSAYQNLSRDHFQSCRVLFDSF